MHENKSPLVDNLHDRRFTTLLSLQNPHTRSHTGLYLIEGIRHVARAVEHGARIQSVFTDPSRLTNPFGQKLARRLRKSGLPGVRLSPLLYRDLTLAADPQGIGAVVQQQWATLSSLKPARNGLWLGVESIESPGNLGTIIRTAEATGVNGIFMLGSDLDPHDPACVRASMGSLFSQMLMRCTHQEFREGARSGGVVTVASSPTGLVDYKSLRYRWPTVLLVGNEKRGLSEQSLEISDYLVRIPMCGRCDSINVAVATGVLLFEMEYQRRNN
jgi:RNA methyltransferase, TrmH family